MSLLRLHKVRKRFPLPLSIIKRIQSRLTGQEKVFWVVDKVSFDIGPASSVGLLGESGCGKTTLGKIILGLFPIDEGRVEFGEKRENIFEYSNRRMYSYRRKVQMVFQNPDAALNPRMRVGKMIEEAINFSPGSGTLLEYLSLVKLTMEKAREFPDNLSGGEKKRIALIRALAVCPDLVVADEPFTGLDASIRNEMINFLLDIQDKRGTSFLFISHDVNVIKYLCSQAMVMYLGKIVEAGPVDRVISNRARHPYTKGLLAAADSLYFNREKNSLGWEISTRDIYSLTEYGCPFRDRCFVYGNELTSQERPRCEEDMPGLTEIDRGKGHQVACHYH